MRLTQGDIQAILDATQAGTLSWAAGQNWGRRKRGVVMK